MTRIELPGPLLETVFVERPNRFLVRCLPPDAAADADPYDAHLADPGRLKELLLPGRRVWLRAVADAPHRRTRWSAVLVESPDGDGLVSVDTTMPNRLIRAALEERTLDEFRGWSLERREVVLGRSRIDFVLRREDGRRLALEVKSVTLVEDGEALFPDAVTARGARHVGELAALARGGEWDAAILFVLQRPDANRIRAASDIDPVFARALADAKAAGVRVYGRRCRVSPRCLTLGDAVPAG
ncbi:MAG TPA: DNA/RNA nuclease SfsA [Longimicrobiales bacterium]|nr:DNA/RNA nuclease SfsA [Longimicrobiales bacterium]